MASLLQIAANLANAKKSTGPKSPEGQAASSLNRLSHGFASATMRLMPGEDPEELKALVADYMREHQPATPTEQSLVEQMAQDKWLAMRAFRLQNDLFVDQFFNKNNKLDIPPSLALLIRYQNTAERGFHKAHNELVKTQKERRKSEIGFVPQNAAAKPEKEPEVVPVTSAEPVPSAEFPASAPPAAKSAPAVAPDAPEIAKNAA